MTLSLEEKIELTEQEARIYELLGKGHKNAIGKADLCKRLDINERKLREVIFGLRQQKYLICFGQKCVVKNTNGTKTILPSGYFIAETYEEVLEFYRYMKSRIIEECRTMRQIKIGAKLHFSKEYGQLPLF